MGSSQPSEQREALRLRLRAEGEFDLAHKLTLCAAPFYITCTACGDTRAVDQGCKKRWCPVCSGKISAARVALYTQAAQQMQWPLFVTLTKPGDPAAKGCIRRLRKELTAFRRTHLFSHNVRGGICGIEVTNSAGTWHVHAHLLVDCEWLALKTPRERRGMSTATRRRLRTAAHEELSAAWGKHVGIESAVVWVSRAFGKVLVETVKYSVKPAQLISCKRAIGDLIREMHRQQLVNGFGSCYGQVGEWKKQMRAARPACQCDKCKAVGTLKPDHVAQREIPFKADPLLAAICSGHEIPY